MYGNTLCSAEYASSPIYKIAYLEEEMDGDLGQVYTIHESLGIQFDKGFDARLGMLLFLWASIKYGEFMEEKEEVKGLEEKYSCRQNY